jgi:DMSO/TMAO reductase YedYZ molybdopterin-dependent catalytic subunit
VLAGGVALGVGQLVAGFTGATGSPVVSVGEMSIDFTPPAVKNFAIRAFGSHDKLVLVSGILVVLAIFAAIIGVVAVRNLRLGIAGLGIFAVIGVIAAATRPTATAADVLPTLAGAAAAMLALVLLIRAARPARAPVGAALAGAIRADRPAVAAEAEPGAADAERGAADGGGWVPNSPARAGVGSGGPPPSGPPGSGPPRGGPPDSVPSRSGPLRRSFLATGVAVAGTAAIAGVAGRLLTERQSVAVAQQALRLPAPAKAPPRLASDVDLKIPGLSSFITPNSKFYRVDTAIVLPEIPPSSWQLRIHGMVDREIVLSFDELIRRPLIEEYITLTCVSNPVSGPYIGNARWLGTSLRGLLQQAGMKAGADQLFCTSSDGFTSGSPVLTAMDGRDSMLAIAMNGAALPVEHGFPVRMVVPGLYGYVSACKWITDIEVTTYSANTAYWAQRGWSQQAPIKTESRIDVPNGLSEVKPGKVTVAGVAWAQHKGIDAVEVRVDRGPWHRARLAAVPDIDTWRQWVWDDWNAIPGSHVIEARATDATGYTQTAVQAPPEPNGASGYPSVSVTVSS